MNQKIVQELLKQLQQENQDPQDIGKLNIPNTMLWMKKKRLRRHTSKEHPQRNRNTKCQTNIEQKDNGHLNLQLIVFLQAPSKKPNIK